MRAAGIGAAAPCAARARQLWLGTSAKPFLAAQSSGVWPPESRATIALARSSCSACSIISSSLSSSLGPFCAHVHTWRRSPRRMRARPTHSWIARRMRYFWWPSRPEARWKASKVVSIHAANACLSEPLIKPLSAARSVRTASSCSLNLESPCTIMRPSGVMRVMATRIRSARATIAAAVSAHLFQHCRALRSRIALPPLRSLRIASTSPCMSRMACLHPARMKPLAALSIASFRRLIHMNLRSTAFFARPSGDIAAAAARSFRRSSSFASRISTHERKTLRAFALTMPRTAASSSSRARFSSRYTVTI